MSRKFMALGPAAGRRRHCSGTRRPAQPILRPLTRKRGNGGGARFRGAVAGAGWSVWLDRARQRTLPDGNRILAHHRRDAIDTAWPGVSPSIAEYVQAAQDAMDHETRQKLLVLVPGLIRCSGDADAPEIESARRLLLAQRSLSLLVPLVFEAAGWPEEAEALRGSSGSSFARLRGPLREAAESAATNALVAAVIDCAQKLVACANDGQPARQSCGGPRTIICSFSARFPLAPRGWVARLADTAGVVGLDGTSPLWASRISCSSRPSMWITATAYRCGETCQRSPTGCYPPRSGFRSLFTIC